MADSGRLHRHPDRKPSANVSGTDRDYIWAMMEGVSKRRKLSHASTEKHTQMLYKVAAYPGERGQSLERSDNKTLSELSERVFKKNKHVGVAVRALQEPRGGVRVRGRPLLERAMPPCPNLSNKSFRRTGGALDEDAFVAQSMFPVGT
ncbi:hypothetical protein [Bradyrhizobium sp. UFLA03-84]|uniref:hypothetical protein n=1 Tax=Bradyrhizobium sp. UFLA03-84 TaxID=418599 RepID=UPI0011779574|nr:hypothetical protein [Bradyrhizobium sp. UFLA03-84]